MFARRSIWVRIVAGMLLAAVLVGAGFFIFRAGQASGLALSQAGNGQTLPGPFNGRGHLYPLMPFRHFFPGLGLFFLCAVPFGFLLLFGGLFRWMWWGRAWRHGYGSGPHPWHDPSHPGGPGGPGEPTPSHTPEQPSGQA